MRGVLFEQTRHDTRTAEGIEKTQAFLAEPLFDAFDGGFEVLE
jgi:hypothetical protein